MNDYSNPLWLARNCDEQDAFETACGNALRRLHDANQALLQALAAARDFISVDRVALLDSITQPDGSVDQDDAEALQDYDMALERIDAVISFATGTDRRSE